MIVLVSSAKTHMFWIITELGRESMVMRNGEHPAGTPGATGQSL